MKKELQESLVKTFSTLYEPDFEFRCDDGWYQLIYNMSEEVIREDERTVITTVKEKFGELRVYSDSVPFSPVIDKYEKISRYTCEMCGSTENAKIVDTGNRWFKCMCKECLLRIHLEQL